MLVDQDRFDIGAGLFRFRLRGIHFGLRDEFRPDQILEFHHRLDGELQQILEGGTDGFRDLGKMDVQVVGEGLAGFPIEELDDAAGGARIEQDRIGQGLFGAKAGFLVPRIVVDQVLVDALQFRLVVDIFHPDGLERFGGQAGQALLVDRNADDLDGIERKSGVELVFVGVHGIEHGLLDVEQVQEVALEVEEDLIDGAHALDFRNELLDLFGVDGPGVCRRRRALRFGIHGRGDTKPDPCGRGTDRISVDGRRFLTRDAAFRGLWRNWGEREAATAPRRRPGGARVPRARPGGRPAGACRCGGPSIRRSPGPAPFRRSRCGRGCRSNRRR